MASSSQSSSSSSPAKYFSQISQKFKRPDGLASWRASDEIKKALLTKEKEIENDNKDVESTRLWADLLEGQINRKEIWVREAKEEVRKAEQFIRETEMSISEDSNAMKAHILESDKKIDWVHAQKKKFPYEFPEWQTKNNE